MKIKPSDPKIQKEQVKEFAYLCITLKIENEYSSSEESL